MTVRLSETACYLQTAWPGIRERLLHGMCHLGLVRPVTIPKFDGGEPWVGVPTLMDRLHQASLAASVATGLGFSECCFGFGSERSLYGPRSCVKCLLQA